MRLLLTGALLLGLAGAARADECTIAGGKAFTADVNDPPGLAATKATGHMRCIQAWDKMLTVEADVKNGVLEGTLKRYEPYKNGKLTEETQYARGKRNGRHLGYESGRLRFDWTYKDDEQRGVQKTYHVDSKFLDTVEWVPQGTQLRYCRESDALVDLVCAPQSARPEDRKLCGFQGPSLVKLADCAGNVRETRRYDKGVATEVVRYLTKAEAKDEGDEAAKQLGMSARLAPGPNAAAKLLYPGGKPKQTWTMKNGEKDGVERSYGADGQLLRETTYAAGEVVAERQLYKNGALKAERKRSGNTLVVTDYYDDGTKQREETFADGRLDGVAKVYDEDGTLRGETTYKAGTRTREKVYDEDGTLVSDDELYDDGSRKHLGGKKKKGKKR